MTENEDLFDPDGNQGEGCLKTFGFLICIALVLGLLCGVGARTLF